VERGGRGKAEILTGARVDLDCPYGPRQPEQPSRRAYPDPLSGTGATAPPHHEAYHADSYGALARLAQRPAAESNIVDQVRLMPGGATDPNLIKQGAYTRFRI